MKQDVGANRILHYGDVDYEAGVDESVRKKRCEAGGGNDGEVESPNFRIKAGA